MQQITLYSHVLGPNPWKVAIILSALGLEYKPIFVSFDQVKLPPFTNINPNGRLPAIIDPNKNITLWESGAIVEYLIDTYDASHKLSYETFPEKYHTQQWLHFQMSGQGPYYGQLFWFKQQPTPEPVAIKRYANEIRRVTSVLEKALEGRDWLVGDKCTYADLCLVPWQDMVPMYYAEEVGDILRDFPGVSAWMRRMKEREDVQKVLREKSEAMEKIAAQK
jgi:glutathione S-transferase